MQRCAICFETDDVHTKSECAHLEYVTTARDEQAYPDELYFCEDCVDILCEVTDYWQFGGADETACAFCGDTDHDGTRISAEFVTQTEIGTTSSLPVYDLCSDCDAIFDTFIAAERIDSFTIPDGWDVLGPVSRHLVGFKTGHTRVYVDPAVTDHDSDVSSPSVHRSEADANCYMILWDDATDTGRDQPTEIAAFEGVDDAIEFAIAVTMHTVNVPSSIDPDDTTGTAVPIITDLDPCEAVERVFDAESSETVRKSPAPDTE